MKLKMGEIQEINPQILKVNTGEIREINPQISEVITKNPNWL